MAELEAQLRKYSEEIVSYIQSEPILKEASHAKRLEENPEWALILGLGYNDGQKRNLIYQHLGKMLTELRRVTGGDALKAKQLSDLLYLRAHAGEQRRINATEKEREHRRDVAECIVESIREFVHALHDAGGNGRYPDKLRQAQQVSPPSGPTPTLGLPLACPPPYPQPLCPLSLPSPPFALPLLW